MLTRAAAAPRAGQADKAETRSRAAPVYGACARGCNDAWGVRGTAYNEYSSRTYSTYMCALTPQDHVAHPIDESHQAFHDFLSLIFLFLAVGSQIGTSFFSETLFRTMTLTHRRNCDMETEVATVRCVFGSLANSLELTCASRYWASGSFRLASVCTWQSPKHSSPHPHLQNSALLAHDCPVDRFHWRVCRAAIQGQASAAGSHHAEVPTQSCASEGLT